MKKKIGCYSKERGEQREGAGRRGKADIGVKCLSGITFLFQIHPYEYAYNARIRVSGWSRVAANPCAICSDNCQRNVKSPREERHMAEIKWVKGEYCKLFKCVLMRVPVHVAQYMWEREKEKLFRMEAVPHWQPCSASSLLSFLTSFDIFNYVFHTWLGTCFFFLSMLSLSSFSSLCSSPTFLFYSSS